MYSLFETAYFLKQSVIPLLIDCSLFMSKIILRLMDGLNCTVREEGHGRK